jgi:hypothetical protein
LGSHCKERICDQAKWPGLEDCVVGHVVVCFVGEQAEIQRPPETVGGKLVGISGMIGESMVKPMPIDPGDGTDIDPNSIVYNRDALYKPFFEVKCAMGNPHMKDTRQVQPNDEPASDDISCAYQ